MLPDRFIQDLIDRNDVESVIGSYVTLRRRGRTLVGLCPFHGEKTASFTVYPETTSFYCFGCGAGGDVITFVKRIENLDYMDAVRFLADRAGMKMPEISREDDAVSRLRTRVLEANREAARLYHAALYSPAGAEALDYFHRRGYTDATIRHFGLGYAPPGWDYLLRNLQEKGFRQDELLAAWLIKKRDKGAYDVFRNRVMIPIIDVRGSVVGFGGRVLDDTKPKYINTENTLAYNKSRQLFALNFAKNGGRELNLCEGYMDVIAMHQAGFTNTVASLGTAFPDEQVQLIARYADRVNLIFDADGAGQKATKRAIENLRKTGLDVRVVTIPDGKDPDEYLRKNGAAGFKLLLERSSNAVEYRLLEIGKAHDVTTPDGKVAYFSEAAGVLAELNSPVEQDVYASRLAELLGISKTAIMQEVSQHQRKRQKAEQRRQLPDLLRQEKQEMSRVNPDAQQYPRAARAEEGLIGTLILHPDFLKQARQTLPPEQMMTAFNRDVYRRLLERDEKGMLIELAFLSADLDEDGMAYLSRMVQAAQERAVSAEDVDRYIAVIREEYGKRGLHDGEGGISDEDAQRILETIRARKMK